MSEDLLFDHQVQTIPADQIKRGFHPLKLIDPRDERQLERSISRYGQMNPVIVAFNDSGGLELIDGFKRVQILERITGMNAEVRTRRILGGPTQWKTAMLMLNWGKRSVSPMEEALVLASLNEDGVSQTQIAALLKRDKSWVSRRIALVSRLTDTVKEHLQLGLIHAGTGRELALLPRGNQDMVLEAVLEHRLNMRETECLVKHLLSEKRLNRSVLQAGLNHVRSPQAAKSGQGAGAKTASPAQVLLDAVDGMRLTCEKVLQSVAETKVRPMQEPQLTPVIHGAMEAAQGAAEALARYLLEEEQ